MINKQDLQDDDIKNFFFPATAAKANPDELKKEFESIRKFLTENEKCFSIFTFNQLTSMLQYSSFNTLNRLNDILENITKIIEIKDKGFKITNISSILCKSRNSISENIDKLHDFATKELKINNEIVYREDDNTQAHTAFSYFNKCLCLGITEISSSLHGSSINLEKVLNTWVDLISSTIPGQIDDNEKPLTKYSFLRSKGLKLKSILYLLTYNRANVKDNLEELIKFFNDSYVPVEQPTNQPTCEYNSRWDYLTQNDPNFSIQQLVEKLNQSCKNDPRFTLQQRFKQIMFPEAHDSNNNEKNQKEKAKTLPKKNNPTPTTDSTNRTDSKFIQFDVRTFEIQIPDFFVDHSTAKFQICFKSEHIQAETEEEADTKIKNEIEEIKQYFIKEKGILSIFFKAIRPRIFMFEYVGKNTINELEKIKEQINTIVTTGLTEEALIQILKESDNQLDNIIVLYHFANDALKISNEILYSNPEKTIPYTVFTYLKTKGFSSEHIASIMYSAGAHLQSQIELLITFVHFPYNFEKGITDETRLEILIGKGLSIDNLSKLLGSCGANMKINICELLAFFTKPFTLIEPLSKKAIGQYSSKWEYLKNEENFTIERLIQSLDPSLSSLKKQFDTVISTFTNTSNLNKLLEKEKNNATQKRPEIDHETNHRNKRQKPKAKSKSRLHDETNDGQQKDIGDLDLICQAIESTEKGNSSQENKQEPAQNNEKQEERGRGLRKKRLEPEERYYDNVVKKARVPNRNSFFHSGRRAQENKEDRRDTERSLAQSQKKRQYKV